MQLRFLDATTHLYKRLCPSVPLSVRLTMVQNRVILRHLAKIDFSPSALGLSHGLGWYLGHMEWSIKVTGTLHLFRQVLVFDH